MSHTDHHPHGYAYPNKMGRIILASLQRIVSEDQYVELLSTPELNAYAHHLPPDDLELAFPFTAVSALQTAVEATYGAEQGHVFNQQIGRACLEGGLREFNPLLGIADLPARILPLGLKLHVGFDMFAMVFNRFTDQVVTLREDDKTYKWVIQRCPVCWERQTDHPCCHLAVGILEEGLHWASGGRKFHVAETQCIAMGDDACVIEIEKHPIG